MQLGASFSHQHLESLNCDPEKAIKEFKKLGLKWVRLGCYWSEIEREKGKYDFSKIEPLVKYCEKNDINVVMTVGMKCFRWPEYYIPDWQLKNLKLNKYSKISKKHKSLHENTLKFISQCIATLKTYKCIKVWQVENEPLNPIGEKNWRIGIEFLLDEINLVRKLDSKRKVLVNFWGSELLLQRNRERLINASDILGFDIYLKRPLAHIKWFKGYVGLSAPKSRAIKYFDKIKAHDKKVWIAELQAEPWEKDELVAKSNNPPSFLPEHFNNNLNYAKDLNPDVVLLWGFEYWYWRKKKMNDSRYWDKALKEIKKYSN